MNIPQLQAHIFDKIKNEIPSGYTYHSIHHTEYVLQVCEHYIVLLGLAHDQGEILRASAITHDVGLIWCYKNHEEASIMYIKNVLPEFGFNTDEIAHICSIVAATKLPQQPFDLLSKILCDADLDYLGTTSFERISSTLFQEFLNIGIVSTLAEYDDIQIRFLSEHQYHTDFAKQYRDPIKQKHLELLIKNRS